MNMELLMLFFSGILFTALVIGLGLSGWCSPKWSQRWGNMIVVLSVIAMFYVQDAPDDDVWADAMAYTSLTLALIGAFWAAIGDGVCLAFSKRVSWQKALSDMINEPVPGWPNSDMQARQRQHEAFMLAHRITGGRATVFFCPECQKSTQTPEMPAGSTLHKVTDCIHCDARLMLIVDQDKAVASLAVPPA